ncbi:hypothetical protein ACTXT7_011686 [Hymenolepis weldensis]
MSKQKITSFKDLGLNDQILQAIDRLGWKVPTEIQAQSIPHALRGRNLIGLAETGSGKTGAYVIPILQELMVSPKHYFALILAPTRELAAQVQAQCNAFGTAIGLSTILLVGGTPIGDQANQMAMKPPHVLIATPGRFIDHLRRTKGFDEIKLKNMKFLVIDEADRMLGSDFESVIEKVLVVLPPKRQTFLFSATMTEKVGKLQRASLRDPVRISTRTNKFQTVESLRQYVLLVPQAELETYLVYLVRTAFSPTPSAIEGLEAIKLTPDETHFKDTESRSESMGSAIIFTRTRETSNKLSLLLRQFLNAPVITLNGDMPQAQRLGALSKFKRLPASVLVATDVASRGLDIPQVGLVINFDVPLDAKTYMHRVGRTARAGRQGAALTLLTQFSVVFYMKEIENHLVNTTRNAEGEKVMEEAKVPALLEPGTPADAALDAAVAELNVEVQAALALASKTVDSLRKKPGKREAFVAVDDMKVLSTSEIAVPEGSRKRTAWANEASEAKKAQISAVLSAVSVSDVAETLVTSHGPVKSLKDKKRGRKGNKFSPPGDTTAMRTVPMKSKNKAVKRLFKR